MNVQTLLIDLYRSAQQWTPDRFERTAVELLTELIDFDCGVWCAREPKRSGIGDIKPFDLRSGSDAPLPSALIKLDGCGLVAATEPGSAVQLKVIKQNNLLMARKFAKGPGGTLSVLDALSMGVSDPVSGWISVLSLWRRRHSSPFSGKDACLLQLVMQHLVEARKVNRQLQLRTHQQVSIVPGMALAWCSKESVPLTMEPPFRRLAHLEWPGWTGGPLSPSLAQTITNNGVYLGRHLRIESNPAFGMYRLSAVRLSSRGVLTEREREIASYYVEGQTYRDIAIRVGIAENTVRAHLHRIFRKLRIHTKAELIRVANSNRLDIQHD